MTTNHTRADGVIIVVATGVAMILMLHHPTSFTAGRDDGLLLSDWSNSFVHAAMIGCLIALAVGVEGVKHRLDATRVLTRAGALLIGAGFLALASAAMVNGLATGRLFAATSDPVIREAGGRAFWALNQSLTALGTLLVATGAAAWSPGLWRLSMTGRVAAGLGVALLSLAVWHTVTDGGFGLHVAVGSMAVFAVWSTAVAAVMILARPEEDQ